jgi:hypothetical protein
VAQWTAVFQVGLVSATQPKPGSHSLHFTYCTSSSSHPLSAPDHKLLSTSLSAGQVLYTSIFTSEGPIGPPDYLVLVGDIATISVPSFLESCLNGRPGCHCNRICAVPLRFHILLQFFLSGCDRSRASISGVSCLDPTVQLSFALTRIASLGQPARPEQPQALHYQLQPSPFI